MTHAGGSGRPLTNSVVARWEGGWRCRVAAGGFELVVDEPEDAGGAGAGPMPTEYLLAAVASCYALALAWVAGKRDIALPGLTVTATGTYDGPRFSRLQLSVESDAPPGAVERLVEPALRVCYVSNTIAESPPIEVVVGTVSPAKSRPLPVFHPGTGSAPARPVPRRLGLFSARSAMLSSRSAR